MRAGGAWIDVCIRNLSSRGLLVQAADPPEAGTYVEILRGDQIIIGRTMWAKDRRFGVHSQARIDIDALIREPVTAHGPLIAHPDGKPIQDRRSDIRRPAPVPLGQQLEKSRRMAAMLQFGVVTLAGFAAAIFTASAVHDILSVPLRIVAAHLSGSS